MHSASLVLGSARSGAIIYLLLIAAVVAYLLLIVIPGRMRIWEKKLNDVVFMAVVVFVGIRVLARYVFHGGLIFHYALLFAGAAAAIGIPLRIKAVIARYAKNSGNGAVN